MVDINLIKSLRNETGAGMGDCKKALEASNGDLDLAKDHLRKAGVLKALKKSDRNAEEGVISFKVAGNRACMVELNSETDFVARNEKFQNLALTIADLALANSVSDLDAIKSLTISSGTTVADSLIDHISALGEKINLSRITFMEVKDGVIAGYMHGALSEGVGRVGALVALDSKGDPDRLQELGKQLAMHIVAMKPLSLSADQLDKEILDKERAIITAQVQLMNKPQPVADKVIEGMLSKFYQDSVLLEQNFVIDNKTKVADLLESFGAQIGHPVKIASYVTFTVGDSVNS